MIEVGRFRDAALTARDRYGIRLVDAYQAFKHAEDRLKAKVLIVESILSRASIQLEFVKRVAGTMQEEHCRIHLQVIEMLKSQLLLAIAKIESVVKAGASSSISKLKFVFIRDAIDGTIVQLEQWQRVFDPTWYLILRIGDKIIDAELAKPPDTTSSMTLLSLSTTTDASSKTQAMSSARKLRGSLASQPDTDVPVTLPVEGLDWDGAVEIEYSNTRLIWRTGQRQRPFIVDTIVCTPEHDAAKTRGDASALARKLAPIDLDTFGLLSCHGLVKRRHPDRRQLASINMIFRMPTNRGEPTSLRHHLMHGGGCSLTRILDIARQLANAISFIHTCDFVHKNIRPETVLVFSETVAGTSSGSWTAYLVGFDSFRSVNFQTSRRGDTAWERNLYHHPSRQGMLAREAYRMQHDVYSLGVCLLELGLWESFIRSSPLGNGDSSGTQLLPSDSLELSPHGFEQVSGG